MKLTNRNVEAQKPAPPPYEKRDDDIKGFLVRIQPTGKKTYYISYNNVEGKRQRYRIGTHGTITAAQAREVAEKQAGKVALEIDVQRAKRDAVAQVEINKSKTLKTFLSEKYEPWAKTERKAGVSTVKMLNAQFQNFMDTPLDAIGLWDKAPCTLRFIFVTESAWDIGCGTASLVTAGLMNAGIAFGWAVALATASPPSFSAQGSEK